VLSTARAAREEDASSRRRSSGRASLYGTDATLLGVADAARTVQLDRKKVRCILGPSALTCRSSKVP